MDTLHAISSGLLMPAIAVLLFMLALSVVELGAMLVEALTGRRKMKVNVTELIGAWRGKDAGQIMGQIERGGLLRRQKAVLGELVKHADLPPASLRALARRLLSAEELRYTRITNRTDVVTRLGPMFGLMATLIPLGPGMIALGQGDTKTLADSLLTAFDATVTGLAAGGIAFVVSRLRKRWYEDHLSSLEALMEGLMEVLARGRGIEEEQPLEGRGG